MKKFLLTMTHSTWSHEAVDAGATDNTGTVYSDKEFSSLAEIAAAMREYGLFDPSSSAINSGTWFTVKTPEVHFRSGDRVYYSFHPKGLTDAEMAELNCLLSIKADLFYGLYSNG